MAELFQGFSIDSEELYQLGKGFIDQKEIQGEVTDILRRTAEETLRYIDHFAPKNTGNLIGSFGAGRVVQKGNSFEIEVYSDYDVAGWVEEGTGIHPPGGRGRITGNMIVEPEFSQFKAFKQAFPTGKYTAKKGKPPFIKSHSGQEPQFYFKRAVEVADNYMRGRLLHFRVSIGERLSAIRAVQNAAPVRTPKPLPLSNSGRSVILSPGNFDVFTTKSVKTGRITNRLGKGPGGGQFTFSTPKKTKIERQRRKARKRRRR